MGIKNYGPGTIRMGGALFYQGFRLGLKVINKTGSDIAAGKVVAVSGFDTTAMCPKVVLADVDVAGHDDLFITFNPIANDAEGNVYKGGVSAANLDTNSATAAGDPVYGSTTAGDFQHTAPNGSDDDVQPLGWVMVKSATLGQIYWHISPVRKNGTNRLT